MWRAVAALLIAHGAMSAHANAQIRELSGEVQSAMFHHDTAFGALPKGPANEAFKSWPERLSAELSLDDAASDPNLILQWSQNRATLSTQIQSTTSLDMIQGLGARWPGRYTTGLPQSLQIEKPGSSTLNNLGQNALSNLVRQETDSLTLWRETARQADAREFSESLFLQWQAIVASEEINYSLEASNYPWARLLRDPSREMGNGTPPVPDLEPLITALTLASFGSGTVPVSWPEPKSGPCSSDEPTTRDVCFLPTVAVMGMQNPRHTEGPLVNQCSATIIGPRHVLTAAHCVCHAPKFISFGTAAGLSTSDYNPLGAKALLLDERDRAGGLTSALFPILGAPLRFREAEEECDPERGGLNDLALLTLDLERDIPSGFIAILIDEPETGSVVNLAGFGPDDVNRLDGNIKRYISKTLRFSQDMLELKADGNRDSCRSDSGSGAYLRLRDGRLGIFGVLSTGGDDCVSAGVSKYVPLSRPDQRAWLEANVPGLVIRTFIEPADDFRDCIGLDCKPKQK